MCAHLTSAAFSIDIRAVVLHGTVRRHPRLLSELLAARADVICLQEVQFEAPVNADVAGGDFSLPKWLQLGGYEAVLPEQTSLAEMSMRNSKVLRNPSPVGNVLLYNTSRLQPVACIPMQNTTTRVGAVLEGLPSSALATLAPTAMFSVHLDATDESQRVKQLATCLKHATHRRIRELVIAGDMNSEFLPGSCVRELLDQAGLCHDTANSGTSCSTAVTADQNAAECASAHRLASLDELTEEQLAQWSATQTVARAAAVENRIRLSRVPTNETRIAWKHDQPGTFQRWRLDHILYTSRTLALRHVWETVEGDSTAIDNGIPCATCPSD
eukprot:SAG31_NODE_6981_length_1827_cov_3.899884_1_plen_327_part_10